VESSETLEDARVVVERRVKAMQKDRVLSRRVLHVVASGSEGSEGSEGDAGKKEQGGVSLVEGGELSVLEKP